jgi:DNA-binding NtrC family response regulator
MSQGPLAEVFLPERSLPVPLLVADPDLPAVLHALGDSGHRGIPAADPAGLIRLALETSAPVVICDVDLPGQVFVHLLGALQTATGAPKVIGLSADTREWPALLLAGAYDVLGKPVDKETLTRSVLIGWQRWEVERRHRLATFPATGEHGQDAEDESANTWLYAS